MLQNKKRNSKSTSLVFTAKARSRRSAMMRLVGLQMERARLARQCSGQQICLQKISYDIVCPHTDMTVMLATSLVVPHTLETFGHLAENFCRSSLLGDAPAHSVHSC